ncbi:peptide chain release factor N(5)-glutamine methyltransferase [Candidatus Kapabacteria bacterium]|nr:peptide chain release factor N(5)-glutamine methyltransferase [Candidatus Kapabacteria bacterium]
MDEKVWRIIDIIKWAEPFLSGKNIASPRLSIELLLCEILNLKRIDLYMKFDQPLLETELAKLKSQVLRLANREPIQYIIGHTSFFDLTIKCESGVLIPRPETEELCDIIINKFKGKPPLSILDIGTGSGCIALALAKAFPESEVYAIDVSEQAIKIAEDNKRINKISNVKFFKMNILEKLPKKQFSVIVSNPPYIPSSDMKGLDANVSKFEPSIALTDFADGLTFYKYFADNFVKTLNNDGNFFLELSEDTSQKIKEIFESKNLYDVEIIRDAFDKERFLIGNINN